MSIVIGGTTLCYPDKFLTDSPEIKYHDFHRLVLLQVLPGKFEDKLNLLGCWVESGLTQDHQTQAQCIKTKQSCLQ